jgi:hypothetical protein
VAALAGLPNSFGLDNRVRCFNHTLQLFAKTLLRPFNAGLGNTDEDATNAGVDDLPDLDDDDNDNDNDDKDNENSNSNSNRDSSNVLDDLDADADDGVNELNDLDSNTREELLADTAAIRQTVSKASTYPYQYILFH